MNKKNVQFFISTNLKWLKTTYHFMDYNYFLYIDIGQHKQYNNPTTHINVKSLNP